MPTCLILGATRGIGEEMARQYAQAGYRVLGSYRHPEDGVRLSHLCARTLQIDLLQPGWGTALRKLADESLDLAVLVAGVLGPRSDTLVTPEVAQFDAVMRTNVLGAMEAIPALAQGLISTGGKLAVISSRMGSIAGTASASRWLYRASKAALNSVLKSASVELGACGVVCVALHPGWVRTDMGGEEADLSVQESVTSMRRVIAAANRSHNGRFLNYNGEQLEW
jgi:NAD(P)-dependent dehydrogenase (short-subunit alcohol dehydrogenase family)